MPAPYRRKSAPVRSFDPANGAGLIGVTFRWLEKTAIFCRLSLSTIWPLIASVPFALQAVLWLIVSGVTLMALRPFAMKNFHRALVTDMSRPTKSALTNLKGVVEVTVGDENHPGRVKIQGESWKAVTDWMEPIPDGAPIVVKKTYGTTLWVEPA